MKPKQPMPTILFFWSEALNNSKAKTWSVLVVVAFFGVLLIFPGFASAQREFGVCDSTFHTLNADSTVVAGRNRLYLYHNQQLAPLYDFTTADPDEYIRDFDLVQPDLWFVVVGLRYIGGPTKLYRSTNRGLSWQLDTTHFQANNVRFFPRQSLESINNLQHLRGDTLVMFVGYYQSGILYSTNLGASWTKWFDNLIAFYQGMFYCQGRYYIFGYQGDAFRASMFGFDRSVLFSSDSTGLWNAFNQAGHHPPCYNGTDTVRCIFAPHAVGRCGSYQFFKTRIDQQCGLVSVDEPAWPEVRVFPNPFVNELHLSGAFDGTKLELYDVFGRQVWQGDNLEDAQLGFLLEGIYHLRVFLNGQCRVFKVVKAA